MSQSGEDSDRDYDHHIAKLQAEIQKCYLKKDKRAKSDKIKFEKEISEEKRILEEER